MNERQKLDVPHWMISAGERFQANASWIATNGLARWLIGSSSRNYRPAMWMSVEQVLNEQEEDAELLYAPADPDATILQDVPRFKKKAMVVGAYRLKMDDLLLKHKAIAAAAYTYKDKSHVGLLPSESLGLEYMDNVEGGLETVALRSGRNDWRVGLGAWIPSERTIILPNDLEIRKYNIPISDFETLYPRTPLV